MKNLILLSSLFMILCIAVSCNPSCSNIVNNEVFCGNKKMKWVFVGERLEGGIEFQNWQLAIQLDRPEMGERRAWGFQVEVKGDGNIHEFRPGSKMAKLESENISRKTIKIRSMEFLPESDSFINFCTVKFNCSDDLSEGIEKLMVKISWLDKEGNIIKPCKAELMCLVKN